MLCLLKSPFALFHLHLPLPHYIFCPMLHLLFRTLLSALRSHRALVLENLALCHQLNILQRHTKKPRFQNRDRLLWVIFARIWSDWRRSLTLVQPETVIRWHKRDFDTTGDGRADRVGLEDRKYPRTSESLSERCRGKTHSGVLLVFMANC